MKTYKFICIEDYHHKCDVYIKDFEKKYLNIKKDDIIDIYFGPFISKIFFKNEIIYINNSFRKDFLSYFVKYGEYEIEKVIEIGEEYICIKENELFIGLIKQNDIIEILDLDDYVDKYNTYIISININNKINPDFWNKRIDKDLFKEHFLLKNEYRELKINQILNEY